jgi:hypothetical protein
MGLAANEQTGVLQDHLCGEVEGSLLALDQRQIKELDSAIALYEFPTVYFDFAANAEIAATSMREVETAIRRMLVSAGEEQVRDGLANVLYWGYA